MNSVVTSVNAFDKLFVGKNYFLRIHSKVQIR